MSKAPPALLELERVRIDSGGEVCCEDLSGEFDGPSAVLTGAGAAAIAAAVTMTGRLVAGIARFDGRDVGARAHAGRVGIAPSDMPLLPRMTVVEYVATSFRLADLPRSEAASAAAAALADIGLSGLAGRKTETLAPPERRVVLLAQALMPGVKAVFAETPLAGLEGPAARYVLEVLGRIGKTRRWLATAEHGDAGAPERELLMAGERVAILSRSSVVWSGPPGALMESGEVFTVAARGEVDGFLEALTSEGFDVQGSGARFALTLPGGTPAMRVVEIAQQSGASVIELVPALPGKR